MVREAKKKRRKKRKAKEYDEFEKLVERHKAKMDRPAM